MSTDSMTARELLRHAVATVAYRGGKVIRDAPQGYVDFAAGEKTRTPLQVLAHIGDLFDWALSMAEGKETWRDATPRSWPDEVERFFDSLKRFDDYLAGPKPLHAPAEKLFQGPVADALTHVGQLAILRRLCGAPIRGENYFVADIEKGRVGREQATAKREFE